MFLDGHSPSRSLNGKMNHIPPPPPDMYASYSKYDGFDASSDQFRRKSQGKRKRKPLEENDWFLAVYINDEGGIGIVSSGNLEHLEHAMHPVGEQMLRVRRAARSNGEDGEQSHRRSVGQSGAKIKPAAWHNDSRAVTSLESSISVPFRQISFQAALAPSIGNGHHQRAYRTVSQEMPACGAMMGEIGPARTMHQYRVDAKDMWRVWLGNAFRAIQQQTCRFIAKEWIKLIHPKKQSTHPYNGNFPRSTRRDPDSTKPPYWPAEVQHKEPDHIDKEARTILLVHLLMCTPQPEIVPPGPDGSNIGGREILARDMLEVLRKKQIDLGDKWDIIETIIMARERLENYEDGGCDPDFLISVPDFQEPLRPRVKGKKSRSKPKEKRDHEQCNDASDSRTWSPSLPGTPSESYVTPVETDDEDDKHVLSASFSSDTTQMSAPSSGPGALSKSCNGLITHLPVSQDNTTQSILLSSTMSHDAMDFNTQAQLHHQQSSVPQTWPTTGPTGTPLAMSLSNSMVASHMQIPTYDLSYDQESFVGPGANVTNPAMLIDCYHPSPYGYQYEPNMGRDISYRSATSGVNHELIPVHEYGLHKHYQSVFRPHSQ